MYQKVPLAITNFVTSYCKLHISYYTKCAVAVPYTILVPAREMSNAAASVIVNCVVIFYFKIKFHVIICFFFFFAVSSNIFQTNRLLIVLCHTCSSRKAIIVIIVVFKTQKYSVFVVPTYVIIIRWNILPFFFFYLGLSVQINWTVTRLESRFSDKFGVVHKI